MTNKKFDQFKTIFHFLFVASGMILFWAATLFIFKATPAMLDPAGKTLAMADQMAILLGAASLGLFILSILLAVIALLGWKGLQASVKRKVERSIEERVRNLEYEMRGRVYTALGVMTGEMSIDQNTLEPKNPARLADAVELCTKGYSLLEKVGGAAEYMGLNNLVYFSAVLKDETRRDYILKKAEALREMGEKHNAHDLLLTYCKAILQYGNDLPEDMKRAKRIAEGLVSNSGRLTEQQRKEARRYMDSFRYLER